jgi:hypothetical protein
MTPVRYYATVPEESTAGVIFWSVRYIAAVPDDVVGRIGMHETIRRALRISEEGAPENLHLLPGDVAWKICLEGREYFAVRHKGINEDNFLLYLVV